MKKWIGWLLLLACLGGVGYMTYREMTERLQEKYMELRGHDAVLVTNEQFTEAARQLRNPNRGFYYIHGFRINDENIDFRQNLADRFCRDEETTLSMIQINLQYFRDKEISEQGLKNIESLFQTLRKFDKRFIIRFLYDWDGKNKDVEPESLEIILRHMEQVGPILTKYKDCIYLTQGLFIGNWGEMNGTRYANREDVTRLAQKIISVTDPSIYVCVRMPMFWRMATDSAKVTELVAGDGSLPTRLGLYNDGMLGSYSDYGTYGDHSREQHGDFTYWNREEELAFQEELCKRVPIGGEVIVNNPYNDFANAVQDMARMHVSYINRDYDRKVLDKWAETTVQEEGCFNGLDGLSYIERHLGYRILIKNTTLDYTYDKDTVMLGTTLKNVGFAPVYDAYRMEFVLYQKQTRVQKIYPAEGQLRDLTGGMEQEKLLNAHYEVALFGEPAGEYEVYFRIVDPGSGKQILLANEQDPQEFGYYIGSLTLQEINRKGK